MPVNHLHFWLLTVTSRTICRKHFCASGGTHRMPSPKKKVKRLKLEEWIPHKFLFSQDIHCKWTCTISTVIPRRIILHPILHSSYLRSIVRIIFIEPQNVFGTWKWISLTDCVFYINSSKLCSSHWCKRNESRRRSYYTSQVEWNKQQRSKRHHTGLHRVLQRERST